MTTDPHLVETLRRIIGSTKAVSQQAADRIEELEAALRDAMTLLPPERWGMTRPSTRASWQMLTKEDR